MRTIVTQDGMLEIIKAYSPITTDLATVTQILQEEIAKSSDMVKDYAPDILINSIGADAMELRILIWIANIYYLCGTDV